MEEITISVNAKEYNQILDSLSKEPYREVYDIINKLNSDVTKQLEDKNNKNKDNGKD